MTELFWNQHASWPMLGTLQVLPLIGALLVWKLGETPLATNLARLIAGIELLLAIALYHQFDVGTAGYQFAERIAFLPIGYHTGADGITVLFVLLAALIVFLVTLYTLVRGLTQSARLLAVILAIEASLMVQLSTFNLLWFVFASGIELLLVGYLIGHWSNSLERDVAQARFYQFQGMGMAMLLMGVLTLAWTVRDMTGGAWSADLFDLAGHAIPPQLGAVIFFLLFYGLGVRTPIFPLHGWLPTVAQHGNVAMAPALLLGVKIGIYGMLRFVLPVLPDAAMQWAPQVVGFAAAGVFYAALLAFQQNSLRRLIAFAVISHTSLVVIGIFTLESVAMQGGLLLALNFGLAATTLMLMTGLVYRRTQTTSLNKLGGLIDVIPGIGLAFLVAGLAIVGMPGTPGFDGAHLMLEGAIDRFGALPTIAAALGNVAAAGFLLWAFQRAFLAPAQSSHPAYERVSGMEALIAGILVVVMLVAGFYSSPWLDLIETPIQALAEHFSHE
ncbi:MAG: NADH-quinone oxidoreductase subunit M [Thiobacillus sp.]|nr:NADH-quinone oxidoreductase subunit M [Thiobacillus sp.]